MGIEQEQKAYEFMEKVIKDNKVFIDTCSLLYEHSSEFWVHIFPILQKYNKKIIIPYRCIEEVDKLSQSQDGDKVKSAIEANKSLVQLQKANLLDIRGEKNDNFADNVFLVQFTKFRMSYKLLLITQDRNLGKEILALNKSKAVRGNKVSVLRINKYGFLSRHESEESEHRTSQHTEVPTINQVDKFEIGTHVTNISDESITVSHIPSEGEKVKADNQVILLGKELGKGGEGSIFETNTPYVAKIYKSERITQRRYAKLKLMISKKIAFKGICYPVSIIYNQNDEFVGYLMPRANGKEIQRSIFIKPLLMKNFPNWKKIDTVKLCITILEKIKYLNERNIILGDINPANILVVSPNEVYFVDTDSYQIGEFPCPVGTVNYTAPEIQRKNFASFLRTQGNENFAIATLLFMIMVPGKPPYAQHGGEDPIANIINMDFSYPFGNNSNKKTPDGPWRFIWSHLTYDLKKAFYNTFRKEGDYSVEGKRLNAIDWLKIFNTYHFLLDSGKFREQDSMSEELFPTRFKKNPNSTYSKCKLCGEEIESNRLTEGICYNCLNQGEIYHCKKCGKEILYSNYQKYIKKSKRHEICFDCKSHGEETYATLRCQDCGCTFNFSNNEYEFYTQRGFGIPKRCPSCRDKRKRGFNVSSNNVSNHNSSSSSKCYITTAVCEYYGKPDDCVELETLRLFRDNWLIEQENGDALIKQYYLEAPKIVQWMKESGEFKILCSYLLNHYILPCVKLINERKYKECTILYMKMVKELKHLSKSDLQNDYD